MLTGLLMACSGVVTGFLAMLAHAAGETTRVGGNTNGAAAWVLGVMGCLLMANGLVVVLWARDRDIEEEVRVDDYR